MADFYLNLVNQAGLMITQYKLTFTLIIIMATWIVRNFVVRWIRGDTNFLSEDQRKWMAHTRNASFMFVLCISLFVWRAEVNEFAFSLTALAVAIVVASKEIILCFTGSIQRASARAFQIGEWIEVGSLSGEVIDYNLMSTKIQEIDLKYKTYAYTGRTVTFPNSLFFTTPVKNLNFMKRYVYHEFNISVKETVNLFDIEHALLEQINAHCEDFKEVAIRYNQVIERHAGVDLPGAEPHLLITTTQLADQQIHIRIFCPTEQAIELEHEIRRDFSVLFHQLLKNTVA